jgi:hypothetical protein
LRNENWQIPFPMKKLSDSREKERQTDRGRCHAEIWYKTDTELRKMNTRNVLKENKLMQN